MFGNTPEQCNVHIFTDERPDRCDNCGRNLQECADYDQEKQRALDALPWSNYAVEFVTRPPFQFKVDHTRIPHIWAHLLNQDAYKQGREDGRWDLTLDERFAHETTGSELQRWLWFLANAMAIAAGYDKFAPGNTYLNRPDPFGSYVHPLEHEPTAADVIVHDAYERPIRVPYIEVRQAEGEQIMLVLDSRFFLFTTPSELDAWKGFLADAMAVAAGYTHCGPEAQPFGQPYEMFNNPPPEPPSGPGCRACTTLY